MTLQRFTEIRDEGIFRDFSWNDEELEDFSAINLIYGWNGTGKTTLSRLMDKLGNETKAKKINAKIKIEDNENDIPASKFVEHGLSIKVFNRDYIDKNILTRNYQKQIVFVGKEAEIQSEIEEQNMLIIELTKNKLNFQEEKERKDKKLEDFCSRNAKFIKDTLSIAGIDSSYYRNYDRKNYIDDADRVIEESKDKSNNSIAISLEELLEKIYEPYKEKVNIEIFQYSFTDLASIYKDTNTILSTKLNRVIIKKLENDHDFSEWTREGLRYYDEQNFKVCPWCEQKPPVSRIEKLQKHFDDSYEQLHNKIKNKMKEIKLLMDKISDSQKYKSLNLYSDVSQDYVDSFSKLTLMNAEVEKWLRQTVEALTKKLNRMNEFLPFENDIPPIDINIFENLNKHIKQHNARSQDHHEERRKLCKTYADNKIMENLDEYISQKEAIDNIDYQISKIDEVIKNADEEINRLLVKAKDVKTPLEELNASIIDFFGHDELQFVNASDENGYILTRKEEHEEIPKSLSEGEKTTIALLYFMKSIFDSNFDLLNAIIVFDDPVSSMDSGHLYKAFAAIENIASKVSQTFILTHNFSLFCAIKGKYKYNKNVFSSYMLETDFDAGKRASSIKPLDAMLMNFDSEYHYLFKCLLKVRQESIFNFELHYNLPNMARRFLEMFLAFKYPSSENLTDKMKVVHYDEVKKASILRFVHTFSHKAKIPDPNHEENVIEGAPYIIKTLMEMIESLDKDHYDKMVNTIESKTTTKSNDNDVLSADAEVVADILKKYDSVPPIQAAYFFELDFIPSPGNWAQSELLVIAEVEGNIMQRYRPFGQLETELMESNINCVIKIYTPEEIANSSIINNCPNLIE